MYHVAKKWWVAIYSVMTYLSRPPPRAIGAVTLLYISPQLLIRSQLNHLSIIPWPIKIGQLSPL